MRAAVVSAAVVLSACGPGSAEWRVGPEPACETTSRGTLLLMAQSVPEAAMVPCIDHLPVAWEYKGFAVDSGGSTMRFETDTYDLGVEVTLRTECEELGSAAVSDRLGADLSVADGRLFMYALRGGCIQIEYPTQALAEAAEGVAFRDGIGFLSRADLAEASGWEL